MNRTILASSLICFAVVTSIAQAATSLEATGQAYMDSLLSQNREAAKQLVRPGSQADRDWQRRAENVARIQADKAERPVAFKHRGCIDQPTKAICKYVMTTPTGDGWSLALHIDKSDGKVYEALMAAK